MAHIEFRFEKSVIAAVGLHVGPDEEPVIRVVTHADTVGIEHPLLHKVLPDVLGPPYVLLEPIAGPDLEGLLLTGADHHRPVYVVLDSWLCLESFIHLVGEWAAGHRDEGHVALLVLPGVVKPGVPSRIKCRVKPVDHLEQAVLAEEAVANLIHTLLLHVSGQSKSYERCHLGAGVICNLEPSHQLVTVDLIIWVHGELGRLTDLSRTHFYP